MNDQPNAFRKRANELVRRRGIYGCLGMVVILIPLACMGLISIPQSKIYRVQCTCLSLPADDGALQDWLAEQPGVLSRTVHIQRSEANQVSISIMMARDVWDQPPFPDLEAKCKELGYDLGDGRFEDVRRR